MHAISRILCATSVVAALAIPATLRADEQLPIKLTLHPMAEPSPSLKYRLLPTAIDLTSGNAAVPYGKVTAEQMNFFKKYAHTDIIDEWQEMPLEKIRLESISLPASSILFLEQGAKCKYCDWQLPIGQVPYYTIQLPDAQQSRSYSRILAVKARIEIANGNFDDAVKTFQTNYALARNVAKGETLIHGLIGIAINGCMFPQITEFVQQPKAPNLYWAFTLLPHPLITMSDALDLESQAIELSFPELRDLENAQRNPVEWRDVFHRFAEQVVKLIETSNPPSTPKKSREDLDKLCEESFPAAKRELIVAGMPAEKLDEMSVYQIALIHTLHTSHRLFDSAVKYYCLPYPQAMKGIESALDPAKRPLDEVGEIVPMAGQTLKVLEATRGAVARSDRQIAALRVIEALRLHAANNDGKLPDQLSEISEVPIPDDPVTTKPFDYRRHNDKASLQGPTVGNVPFHYEISMAAVQ